MWVIDRKFWKSTKVRIVETRFVVGEGTDSC